MPVERDAGFKARAYHWKRIGLDVDEIATRYEAHTRRCEICGREEAVVGRLQVDHDHLTKALRGFLCSRCNMGLGYFKDNPDYLAGAISYLQHYQSETVPEPSCIQDLYQRWRDFYPGTRTRYPIRSG